MNEKIKALCEYLDSAKSVYHSVEGLRTRLEEEGYQYLPESAEWNL